MKKTLPIGIDDYQTIIEQNYYYVDKTMFIHDFIENNNYASLITRPRRFGKTLNMSMLRDFFDITKNNNSLFDTMLISNSKH